MRQPRAPRGNTDLWIRGARGRVGCLSVRLGRVGCLAVLCTHMLACWRVLNKVAEDRRQASPPPPSIPNRNLPLRPRCLATRAVVKHRSGERTYLGRWACTYAE